MGEEWSPVSAKLAIVDKGGVSLVDAVSGTRRRIVRARDVVQVSFSPDGHALAYTRANARAGADYRTDIFTVRLSDGVVTQLTREGHSSGPVWGPKWIVFQRLRWAGGISPQARLWLMHPDGGGKRFFARGKEGLYHQFPVFGLDPIELSDDGTRLLACQAFEFGCKRVTFTVPGAKRYGFPNLQPIERRRGAIPVDLSRDGSRVLLDVGSPHDDRNHGIFEIPFRGGRMRLVVANAIEASWRR